MPTAVSRSVGNVQNRIVVFLYRVQKVEVGFMVFVTLCCDDFWRLHAFFLQCCFTCQELSLVPVLLRDKLNR